jgi:hypothetical protein
LIWPFTPTAMVVQTASLLRRRIASMWAHPDLRCAERKRPA